MTPSRWEWRTFGTTFGEAEGRIRRFPAHHSASRETCIVGDATGVSVRVRHLLLDVRVLQEASREGLERWVTVIKEPFPVGASAVADTCRILGAPCPSLRHESYPADEFVEEVLGTDPSLRAVHVRIQRQSFTINECLVDIDEVTFNGLPMRTIGIEMPDRTRVLETVRALGLGRYATTDYVRALRRYLDSTTVDPVG
jgi:hypothetical protein